MKNIKTGLIVAILSIASMANATVLTVSNLGGSQYANIYDAYNAAVNTDTLMVEGSATTYAQNSFLWSKQLVVIGSGINSNKQNFVPTYFGNFSNNAGCFLFGTGGEGSIFYGITFISTINPGNIVSIQFEDCLFNARVGVDNTNITNWSFKNCVFAPHDADNFYFNGCTITNLSISNCIFNGWLHNYNYYIASNFIIDHCLFLTLTAAFPTDAGSGCFMNTTIKNSIFVNLTSLGNCFGTGMNFTNCISYNSVGNGVTQYNNLAFVNYVIASNWSASSDFHPTAPSAIFGGADDGTDIGVHGGSAHFSERGEPLNVNIIRVLNVTNTAAPNGTLNVNITAGKPNDQ